MAGFFQLVRENHNYRCAWLGQVVSEAGDAFNNVAVLSLAVEATGSGAVVSGILISRAIPAVLAGPLAGVVLDRFDRRRIMIASDLIRTVLALAFIITISHPRASLLYLFSALLMFASPFFTSGRSAILPAIASPAELHTANSVTQTTQWATLTVGAMAGGFVTAHLGYTWAFAFNAFSFLFSAGSIALLRAAPDAFRAVRDKTAASGVVRPWREYREGLSYLSSIPLLFAIAMLSVGWAMGGGAAQMLFPLFGEQVFHRGPSGIGLVWGFAGVGLLIGGAIGHLAGRSLSYRGYKRLITAAYVSHGAAYVIFSLMQQFWLALLFICISRIGMAISSVLNFTQLLRHTRDEFRGRVFATLESIRWAVMMISMAAAGIASRHYGARTIGVAAGILGSFTALYWAWQDLRGRLPEPGERHEAAPARSDVMHDRSA